MNTEQILAKIDALFSGDEIPWENLISDLTDSAAYMKGKKSGLEVCLREKVPHLLDIDGDMCHHMHNAVKKFCSFFDKYIEKLWDAINRDIKLSRDIKFALQEIGLALLISYTNPPHRADHRWLSAYDTTEVNMALLQALRFLYSAWISKDSYTLYKDEMRAITVNCTEEGRKHLFEVRGNMVRKWKNLTKFGKEQKLR